ncbi:MAG TPA: alpha/beta fold hydrolase [Burkholderiales bacterium]|nr:alpha/beta fold hydrolase [Burkholderiales bacterium]
MSKSPPLNDALAAWFDAKRLEATQHHLLKILDPFGIGKSIADVQSAWIQHPAELTEALLRLASDLNTLQRDAWNLANGKHGQENVHAAPGDERFSDPVWNENPAFSMLKQYYLAYTRWLQDTLYHTPEVQGKAKRQATFWARQWLDAIAPTNYLMTNPVAIRKFWETGGDSLVRGIKNLVNDIRVGDIQMVDRSGFQVGRNLATTPGAVVFRNELVEVIQYQPRTPQVRQVPVVIIAPWINKFYILDLNEKKSLVRHLLDQGFQVFITSWRNPGIELANTTFDDYMLKGVLKTIEVAREVAGVPRVHAVGYCLGGTALAALMAWLNREYEFEAEVPVAHWTVLTTLVDFSRPGAIEVFIDEASIKTLEEMMAKQGFLDGREMARAFRMLRPNSLIWSYFVHGYLYGETPPAFDVLFWNTDVTRLPRAMHSYYLREFYLHNKLLKKDGLTLAGHPIDLGRIRQPLYAVGCEEDHIAPWKATFSLGGRIKAPVQYTLSNSGHILGIINPPVKPAKRAYWSGPMQGETSEEWFQRQVRNEGSWWERWVPYLTQRCGDLKPAPATLGSAAHPAGDPAPGLYVRET